MSAREQELSNEWRSMDGPLMLLIVARCSASSGRKRICPVSLLEGTETFFPVTLSAFEVPIIMYALVPRLREAIVDMFPTLAMSRGCMNVLKAGTEVEIRDQPRST